MLFPDGNFFYCGTCCHVSFRFACCGNTACNAGGCDQCNEFNRESIFDLIEAGHYPHIESLPRTKGVDEISATQGEVIPENFPEYFNRG